MANTVHMDPTTAATQDLKFYTATVGNVSSSTDSAYGPRSLKLQGSVTQSNASNTNVVGDAGRMTTYCKIANENGSFVNEILSIRTSGGAAVLVVGCIVGGDYFITDEVHSKNVGAGSTTGTHRRLALCWNI